MPKKCLFIVGDVVVVAYRIVEQLMLRLHRYKSQRLLLLGGHAASKLSSISDLSGSGQERRHRGAFVLPGGGWWRSWLVTRPGVEATNAGMHGSAPRQ